VDRGDLSKVASLEWIVGVDPAFKTDVFACVVVGVDRNDPRRLLVGAVRGWEGERADSFEGERLREDEILRRVVEVCRAFATRRVVTDSHKARAIQARLREHGITVVETPFTGDSRRQVFASLRLKLDAGELELPNDPQLLLELRALRVRYTSSGQTVEIPRVGRSHCDRAVALSLCVAAHENGTTRRAEAIPTIPARNSFDASPIDDWNGPGW
jgi:phage terminase large subunit-like protein